jgi:uncharacterized protein
MKSSNPQMLTTADHDEITGQAGRSLRGLVDVAARCPAGHPCVVTCYPLQRRGDRIAPFPTLYWLTCPRLRQAVSHLERDGVITAIQLEVDRDTSARDELLRNHDDYIARRWQLISPEDRHLVESIGLAAEMNSRGIGGMLNRAAVKCLHVHLAHHLASGNVIGRWLVERYGVSPCLAAPFPR